MIKIFPFGDHLLQEIVILVPDKVTSYSVDAIIRLAKRFPQIEIGDPTSLDKLRDEFLDFTLSPMDLPTPTEFLGADKLKKLSIGRCWWVVGKMVGNEPRLPLL